MPGIVWDKVGYRVFESGIDRGVLYLEDGSGVPWNGLTSVTESFDKSTNPVYFDGMKVSELVELGDFSASLKAITYPEEFVKFEGLGQMNSGVFLGDQSLKTFALSYRTRIGTDIDPESSQYKIHLLYNVTAIPSSRDYDTVGDDISLTEFEWEITAIPEEIRGYRPTAHIIIDSRTVDPNLLSDIELMLYGGVTANPQLPDFADLMELILSYFRVEIIDNNDGTWTAVTNLDGYLSLLDDGMFRLDDVNAVDLNGDPYVTGDTYVITDTRF